MKRDEEVPAIHDWHLKSVLAELGLLARLERGAGGHLLIEG